MRRVWKITLAVVAIPVVVSAILVAPPTSELMIALNCRSKPQTPNCIARMRAMGHVWAAWGSLDRAIYWYRRAVEEGDDTASLFHLGWAYEQRGYRDLVERMQARQSALDEAAARARSQTDAAAGPPVEAPTMPKVNLPAGHEDFESAAAAYRKAANRGFAPAMNNLGSMYVSGVFGSAQRDEGAQWIIRAARAGNPLGAINAALLYTGGIGVPANPGEAIRWGQWNGKGVNPGDLAYPTLEHTRMALSGDIEPRLLTAIREVSKRHIPLGMSFKPLQADARLPTFQSVREQFNKQPN